MIKGLFILMICLISKTSLSQILDTVYSFYPSLTGHANFLNSLRDTSIKGNKISFQVDTLSKDVIYATLKFKNDSIYYSGIYKNELLYIEIIDNKGAVIAKGTYRLEKVEPRSNTIITRNNGQTRQALIGYIKYYQRNGYWETYKNGKTTSVYYSRGKKLKIKI